MTAKFTAERRRTDDFQTNPDTTDDTDGSEPDSNGTSTNTPSPVMDVRRIDERGEQGPESALAEVVGYVYKPPSFATVDAEVEYLTALKGARLVQPFGSLHGNTPDVTGLLRCSECECALHYWDYLGFVDGHYDTMSVKGDGSDGDRPPP